MKVDRVTANHSSTHEPAAKGQVERTTRRLRRKGNGIRNPGKDMCFVSPRMSQDLMMLTVVAPEERFISWKSIRKLAKDCYENMSSVPTSGFLVQQVTNGSWLQHLLRDLFARRRDQKMNELLPGGYIVKERQPVVYQ